MEMLNMFKARSKTSSAKNEVMLAIKRRTFGGDLS